MRSILSSKDMNDEAKTQFCLGLINKWQKKLNLQHWKIQLSTTKPAKGHYMEVAMVRLRRQANVRISDGAMRDMGTPAFEKAIVHELVHIMYDEMREEVEFQADAMDPKRQVEYKKRFHSELEKSVEHMAHVLYNLSS